MPRRLGKTDENLIEVWAGLLALISGVTEPGTTPHFLTRPIT